MKDRHAYLILAHKNPWQIRILLETLDYELNDIYLHLDRRASFKYDALRNVCKKSRLYFINPQIRIHWGGVSIVKAEMALLEEAVKEPHSYYHLLSGMDLPIKSQEAIHSFFETADGKEFINLWPIEEHTLKRVRYFTLFPEGSRFFLTNWLNHTFKAILSVLGIERNTDVTFAKGSQWFSITDDCARYITSRKEWVRKVFRHSTMCDEIFIPTILAQSPFMKRLYNSETAENTIINNSNLRLIDWNRGSSIRHPWVFTIEDLDMLKTAPQLWARKFDENIDRNIIIEVCKMIQDAR